MHCQPAASVISVMGGLSAVANAAEVSVTSVQRWRLPSSKGGTGGIIPAKYHKRLIEHAASQGLALPLAAFVDPEAAARLVAAE
jgi:hypothetical protein